MTQLSDIESYIDARPDSALASIRNIDTSALHGRAAKAKFALLHAMALDKNYIDTADTRVIQPAIDWYERHGTPEERLKAYLYLGAEQYNSRLYDQAIVSFEKADEQSPHIEDQNLLGILYSRMAETYTRTFEYAIAESYIEKSIMYFHAANRKDQEVLESIIKAQNLVRLTEWERADSCLFSLALDSTLSRNLKGIIQGYYAMEILYNPAKDDTEALKHFESAIDYNGALQEAEQYCAYAYLLDISGFPEKAESLFNSVASYGDSDRYSYDYWKHRIYMKKQNYKLAYDYLLSAKNTADSLTRANSNRSAANSHREFLERVNSEKTASLNSQRKLIWALSLLGIALLSLITLLQINRRRVRIEEQGRMGIVIDSLKDQIKEIKDKMDNQARTHAKARFAYLAKLYEMVYHLGEQEISNKELYKMVSKEIDLLNKDIAKQEEFERILNQEGNNIMERFKNAFQNLSDEEYRFASLVFAGFDNTTIMLIMGISTLEHTRVKKSRLKQRIETSSASEKDAFLEFFRKNGESFKRNNCL